MPLPDDFFTTVHGFISLPEAQLLHDLAAGVPAGANIIEIGAYQARSTCALAFGAKEGGANVWSIDHHPTYKVDDVKFSMNDNQAYMHNIAHYNLGDIVRTINLPSDKVWQVWLDNVALVWIDGDHNYEQVKRDFEHWSMFTDTVALHDTAGFHPGVQGVLVEALATGEWIVEKFVDSISVLKRVNK